MPQSLPLLLLHGFPFDASIWEAVASGELAPAGGPLLRPNLPGFGGSAAPAGFSMDELAQWLRTWLDAQPAAPDGRVVLAGHSLGGYVALAFAARYPELVAGLALVHSTSAADAPERRQKRDEQIAFLEKNGPARLVPQLVRPLVAPENAARLAPQLTEYERRAAALPVATLTGYIRGMRDRPDQSQVLRQAAFPVMLISGDYDPVLPGAAVRTQHQLLREQKLWLRLTHSGHLGMLEQPQLVGDFLARLRQRATENDRNAARA